MRFGGLLRQMYPPIPVFALLSSRYLGNAPFTDGVVDEPLSFAVGSGEQRVSDFRLFKKKANLGKSLIFYFSAAPF